MSCLNHPYLECVSEDEEIANSAVKNNLNMPLERGRHITIIGSDELRETSSNLFNKKYCEDRKRKRKMSPDVILVKRVKLRRRSHSADGGFFPETSGPKLEKGGVEILGPIECNANNICDNWECVGRRIESFGVSVTVQAEPFVLDDFWSVWRSNVVKFIIEKQSSKNPVSALVSKILEKLDKFADSDAGFVKSTDPHTISLLSKKVNNAICHLFPGECGNNPEKQDASGKENLDCFSNRAEYSQHTTSSSKMACYTHLITKEKSGPNEIHNGTESQNNVNQESVLHPEFQKIDIKISALPPSEESQCQLDFSVLPRIPSQNSSECSSLDKFCCNEKKSVLLDFVRAEMEMDDSVGGRPINKASPFVNEVETAEKICIMPMASYVETKNSLKARGDIQSFRNTEFIDETVTSTSSLTSKSHFKFENGQVQSVKSFSFLEKKNVTITLKCNTDVKYEYGGVPAASTYNVVENTKVSGNHVSNSEVNFNLGSSVSENFVENIDGNQEENSLLRLELGLVPSLLPSEVELKSTQEHSPFMGELDLQKGSLNRDSLEVLSTASLRDFETQPQLSGIELENSQLLEGNREILTLQETLLAPNVCSPLISPFEPCSNLLDEKSDASPTMEFSALKYQLEGPQEARNETNTSSNELCESLSTIPACKEKPLYSQLRTSELEKGSNHSSNGKLCSETPVGLDTSNSPKKEHTLKTCALVVNTSKELKNAGCNVATPASEIPCVLSKPDESISAKPMTSFFSTEITIVSVDNCPEAHNLPTPSLQESANQLKIFNSKPVLPDKEIEIIEVLDIKKEMGSTETGLSISPINGSIASKSSQNLSKAGSQSFQSTTTGIKVSSPPISDPNNLKENSLTSEGTIKGVNERPPPSTSQFRGAIEVILLSDDEEVQSDTIDLSKSTESALCQHDMLEKGIPCAKNTDNKAVSAILPHKKDETIAKDTNSGNVKPSLDSKSAPTKNTTTPTSTPYQLPKSNNILGKTYAPSDGKNETRKLPLASLTPKVENNIPTVNKVSDTVSQSSKVSAHTSSEINAPNANTKHFQESCQPSQSFAKPFQTVKNNKDIEFVSSDPAENADNFNPNWKVLEKVSTEVERYKKVRERWRNLAIPDPNKNLTYRHRRYLPSARPSRPAKRTARMGRSQSCTSVYEEKIRQARREHDEKCRLMTETFQIDMAAVFHHQQWYNVDQIVTDLQNRYCQSMSKLSSELTHTIGRYEEYKAEARAFQNFYQGLDSNEDKTVLTPEQEELLAETERMYSSFEQFYSSSR